jgi:hypothetical protein
VAQGLAPRVLPAQAEVRWKLRMIEQCCARLQKILNQFGRNSRFWYWCRPIASAG